MMELDSMSNNDYTDLADKEMELLLKRKLTKDRIKFWSLRRKEYLSLK